MEWAISPVPHLTSPASHANIYSRGLTMAVFTWSIASAVQHDGGVRRAAETIHVRHIAPAGTRSSASWHSSARPPYIGHGPFGYVYLGPVHKSSLQHWPTLKQDLPRWLMKNEE